MPLDTPLLRPPFPVDTDRTYRLTPRPTRTYHTVLDAAGLVASEATSRIRIRSGAEEVTIHAEHPLKLGRQEETLVCRFAPEGMLAHRLERTVRDAAGEVVRSELVRFDSRVVPLPPTAYPEVMLPFLLSWQPRESAPRRLHAWINDRFVAAVYVEVSGPVPLDLPGGRVEAMEAVMYPDFNDWVQLGRVLSALAKPLAPKYRMWFDPRPPHTVLRFEGSYGPPGAPELVLELIGKP
jgi:hypothetical protein